MKAIEKGEKEPWWQRIVIEPDSENKKIFDLFISFACVLDILFSSYTYFFRIQAYIQIWQNSFLIDTSYMVLVHLLSGILGIDILSRFIQGYFVGRARVTDVRVIVVHYLT